MAAPQQDPTSRRGSGLRQLSMGALQPFNGGANGGGGGALNPALRAMLHGNTSPSGGGACRITFASRAALSPEDASTLDRFRRLRGGADAGAGTGRSFSPTVGSPAGKLSWGASGAATPEALFHHQHDFRTDSARYTESEGVVTPRSELGVVDEGWSSATLPAADVARELQRQLHAQQEEEQRAAQQQQQQALLALRAAQAQALAEQAAAAALEEQQAPQPGGSTSGGLPIPTASPFAAAAAEAPLPVEPRVPPLVVAGPAGSAAGSPGSEGSWASIDLLHSARALPQTEAEVEGLGPRDVERLAAGAAELEARAAVAARLARRRMQAQQAALPLQLPAQPPLLRECALVLAAAEVVLLALAAGAHRASGGLLRVPRGLALAPLAPLRLFVLLLLLAADFAVLSRTLVGRTRLL